MQHENVQKGLLLKLLTDYSNIPAGTWATVDATGTIKDGAWWFTVRWSDYKPIAARFPRDVTEYSLNLWEKELALFEVVPPEEQQATEEPKIESSPTSTLAPKLSVRW